MDPRRFLILTATGLLLSGCAVFRGEAVAPVVLASAPRPAPASPVERSPFASEAVATETDVAEADGGARPYLAEIEAAPAAAPAPATGRAAIAAANAQASAPSRSDAFVGGIQVFAWSPGRVFEVWTAPLRVTTLTLAEGETLVAKAAGDTVRWQIGEASSGEGPSRRTHVLLKPLERGLETNLVLTTNRRVYLIDLRSGTPDEFNAAVAWDALGTDSQAAPPESIRVERDVRVPDPVVMPEGPLDARYRLEFRGRAPRWTPSAVFNDGRRTFIAFHPDLQVDEAPALFIIAPDGEAQLTNYRQAGGLFIVDRVVDRAELRLGDRRPQVVRIRRLEGARP
ncbi:MAG: TrbG/VirB9 family P-type conjugative transfer protein [Brevundimonas sp.]|uniref:Type IV secretion system protein PtlF n=1 Tax=Brevundimonas mediterranea TaxID=74329 RepID=A0A7Z8Y322_9CAUL|nr:MULTISPECIES: TrbG/VirB9 family P-type conjugative transfer protein [Brevundimonas]MBJ7320361.1 TrbG/VirB9 family P-type conjugative transfer protein [Brevundimonas sp.]VDC49780.1 Type IV secretion system protein PtlF [Brevundimonas mediterranea]